MSTPNTPPAPAPTQRPRVRRSVSPEIAALVRQEDAACAAAITTAQAIAAAAAGAANAQIATARARRDATMRAVLLNLGIEDGMIDGTYGLGAATELEIELPAPTSTPAEAPTNA